MSDHDLTPLASRVRALDPWFHQLDLGGGLLTKIAPAGDEPLDHPRPTWELLRPYLPPLAGKSVLDVGCNAGFYSFEAKRLGAARVLGVDAQRREIAQAKLAAEVLSLDVAFERRSVYDLSIDEIGPFDVALALGLLYHCKHPLLALERLFEVTRGTLVLETAVAPADWASVPETWLLGGLPRRLAPAFFIENAANEKEAVFNWFLPTVDCLVALLRAVGFSGVRHVLTSEGRALLLAERGAGAEVESYQARLVASRTALTATAASPFSLRLRAWNTGTAIWEPSAGRETEPGAVLLGIHLLNERGDVLEWDFRRYRFSLPRPVFPGEVFDFDLTLTAPETPGPYRLELDLVREFLAWFEDLGGTPASLTLTVEGA